MSKDKGFVTRYLRKASCTRDRERTPRLRTITASKTILRSQRLYGIVQGTDTPKTRNIQDFSRILDGRPSERVLKGSVDDGAEGTVWVSLKERSLGRQGQNIHPQVLLLLKVFHGQIDGCRLSVQNHNRIG